MEKVVDSKKVEYKECMILYRKICERKRKQNGTNGYRCVRLSEIDKSFETGDDKKDFQKNKKIF
ncbi:MAG: hypothetical protein ACLTIG_00950 [Roseburia hominis]